MFKINNLKLRNFRLFRDTSIDFTQKQGGIYNLVGQSDTMFADSNSSGKSSLSLAIEQAITGTNRLGLTQKDLRHKYTDQLPEITIDMDIEEDNVLYSQNYDRGKAELYVNGSQLFVTGKKTDITDWVSNKVSLRPEIVRNLIYISSKNSLFFTEKDAKQQYRLLVDLLGLGFIEEYEKQVDKALTGLKGEYKQLSKVVEVLQESISNLNLQIEAMPQQQVRNVKESIEQKKAERDVLEKEKKPLERSKHELENTKDQHTDKMSEVGAEIKQIQKQKKLNERLKEEAVCPTCKQALNKSSVLVAYKDYEKQEAEMQTKMTQLDEQNVVYRNELLRMKRELDDIEGKIRKLDFDIKELERIDSEQFKVQAKNKMLSELEAKRDDKTLELIEKQIELDTLEKNMAAHELIKACAGTKGFVSDRIKLFLKLYNQHLTELSKTLLEGEMTIKIVEIKARDYALMIHDGEIQGGLTFNEASEGLQSRVKIVALLALLEVVEMLSGISFNVLFIDELLSNVDSTGMAEIEKLLNKVQHKFPDKLIFVVSHNQRLNNTSGTLVVERKDNESTLSWA